MRQWEMGGFGSAAARMPGFSRYGAGMGRWMLETRKPREPLCGNVMNKKERLCYNCGGTEDGLGGRKISECDAIEVRDTRGTTAKMKCAKDAVYGRMSWVLNSKSDNTSDKKIITKGQYRVVWVVGCI